MDPSFAFALLAASAGVTDATDRATFDDAPRIAHPAEPTKPPTVTVAWVDAQSALSDEATDAMAEEVEAQFREIGIWARTIRVTAGAPIEADGNAVVPVVARRRQPPALGQDRVMGLVLRDHAAPSPVWVFMDNVRATLGRPRRANELGQAVGRVVVHEVIHALAPSHPHAAGGLMAPSLDRSGLLGPRLRPERECTRAVLAGIAVLAEAAPAPGRVGLVRSLLR
jgi:hypothetical protein